MKQFKEFYHARIAWNQGQQPKIAEVAEGRGPKLKDIKRKFKKEIEKFQKGGDLDYKAENALLAWALEYTNDIKTDDADEMDDWLMDKIADKKTFDKLKESISEALGNNNPSHREKPKMDKDGTVHNIPGKKGGLSAYSIKPRLDGKTLKFGTVDNEGNIKVMTVQELAKVLN